MENNEELINKIKELEALGILTSKEAKEKIETITGEYRLTSDTTVKHEGYLSDNKQIVGYVTNYLNNSTSESNILLLESKVGTGKTNLLMNIAKENKSLYIIVLLPNTSTVEQSAIKYGDLDPYAAFGENNITNALRECKRIIFATYDQLRSVRSDERLKKYSLAADESQMLSNDSDFKNYPVESFEMILRSKNFKNILLITATPDTTKKALNLFVLGKRIPYTTLTIDSGKPKCICNITKYYNNPVSKNMKEDTLHKIKEIVDNATGKVLIFYNLSKLEQKAMRKWQRWDYVNSELKHSDIYKSLIEHGILLDRVEVLVFTDLFSAGLNILNPKGEISDMIFVKEYSPEKIKQTSGRPRNNTKLNIHLMMGTKVPKEQIKAEYLVEEETLLEAHERLSTFKDIEQNQATAHGSGFLDGMFTRGLDGTDINISRFSLTHKIEETVNRQQHSRATMYFVRERDEDGKCYHTINEDVLIDMVSDNEFKDELDKVKEKTEIEKETLNERIEIFVDENYEKIALGRPLDTDAFTKNEKKILNKIVKTIGNRILDEKDISTIITMETDKVYKNYIKYSVLRPLAVPGTYIDDVLIKSRGWKKNTEVMLKDYTDKERIHVKKVIKALYETEPIKDGNLLLGYKIKYAKKNLRRVFSPAKLERFEKYFKRKVIKQTKDYIEQLEKVEF